MAITPNTFNVVTVPTNHKVWEVSMYSADASGCEALKAAETGLYHYITDLWIATGSNITVTIGSGGDGGTAVTTIHFGPVPFGTAGGVFHWKAPDGKGVKCTISLSIAVDASGAGATTVIMRGVTSSD